MMFKWLSVGRHAGVSNSLNDLMEQFASANSRTKRPVRCYAKRCATHHAASIAQVSVQELKMQINAEAAAIEGRLYDVAVHPLDAKLQLNTLYGRASA